MNVSKHLNRIYIYIYILDMMYTHNWCLQLSDEKVLPMVLFCLQCLNIFVSLILFYNNVLLAVPADKETGSMNCDFERDYQYIHSISYFPASAFFRITSCINLKPNHGHEMERLHSVHTYVSIHLYRLVIV